MTPDDQRKTYFTTHWPLRPFRLVQNESVSSVSSEDTDKPDISKFSSTFLPIPANYFKNNSGFAYFRRFILLSPPFPFETSNYKPCEFLRPIPVDFFQKASRILEERFRTSPGKCGQPFKTCRQCIVSLYPIIPQRFDAIGLYVSEFLMSLENKNNMSYRFSQRDHFFTKSIVFQKWEMNKMLWAAGESLFQADKIWWGKFGLEILKEGRLTAPTTKNVTAVIGPISFFYDEIPDLVYAFFIDPQCPPEPVRHLIGLTYAMKEARKSWLFNWIGRIADTIMKMEDRKDFEFFGNYRHLEEQHKDYNRLFLKSHDMAMKKLRVIYAREALEWMARVLAFFETSPGNALDQHVSTFLDYKTDDSIEISKSLKEIDTKQDKITIWQPFLSKEDSQGDNFQRSRARFLFIREFLQESANTINSALDVKSVVKIKGSKATTLMADLVRHVRLNPMTGKVLLLGAPGGGKGLTAKRYHELAIEEIKKSEPLLKETIEGIWDRLINILMLPKAQEDMGDQEAESDYRARRLLSFVSAQLQGTTWWRWSLPRNPDEDGEPPVWPCGKTASCTKVSRHKDHNPLKVQDELCEKCPLSRLCPPCQESYLKHLIQLIPSNVASNAAIDPSVQFMAHYLARLLYAVYGIENEARPKMSENRIQILCGVLAEQGPEFISSMRRLFGTAENVKMPMPGLFQTASYMAGTIFLDEIADAPVKIQDNLLGPLEEKKVSRLGWESIEEDVGNIRIVAATHKDIRGCVRHYNDTKEGPSPQGFRPDLLSRLIIFPPVYPSSVTEYFLYENKEERKINQMDFISIMLEILGQKAKEVKYPDDDRRRRFLENLYDTIDDYIKRTTRMMDFPKSQLSEIEKDLASKITTRLFVGILEEVALAERQAEHFAEAQNLESCEQKQKAQRVQGHKSQEYDFTKIVRDVFKKQQRGLNPSYLEKALNIFYQQTENQITKTLKDLNIPSDEQANFKKDLLNAYNKTLEMMKRPADLPQPSQAFLNARLSDILVTNLPKLLNYIVNPEV